MTAEKLYDEKCPLITIDNFIDGRRVESSTYMDGVDPSNNEVFLSIADSDENVATQAIMAASAAFKTWSKTSLDYRVKLLEKMADLIEEHAEEFARAESRDQGKSLWMARSVDVPRGVHNFRIYAKCLSYDTDKSLVSHKTLNYTSKVPVGVSVLITPWNLPFYLLTFKMAPALITGNTIVCKPSEFSPLTASMLCDLSIMAGFPPGVVNMVFGTGAKVGSALVQDPRVRLISFTGSTLTATKIRVLTAPFNKKLSLELGGKNAAIVFDDCDLDKCIKTTIRSSFLNSGQICLCTSRIFVQRGIYQKFLEGFVKETRKLKVGDPKEDNFMGPVNNLQIFTKVKGYLDLAIKEGLNIHGGGELALDEPFKKGFFLRPHVITGMSDDSPFMQEEIFGPITCVTPFDTKDEVISRANDCAYGLCASVWSSNANTIHTVAQQLEVGTVWANCWLVRDLRMPFGGFKDSGIGREGVADSLEFYTEAKVVCLQLADD